MSEVSAPKAPNSPAHSKIEIVEDWNSPLWRLSNIYKIVDPHGKQVTFKPNPAQIEFWQRMWYWDLILKARQIGFSTFVELIALDQCLFKRDFHAAIIADKEANGKKLFNEKVKYAYKRLPPALLAIKPFTKMNETELELYNGSKLHVDVTMRSGTYQLIHISEFGKICKTRPNAAKELVEGTFPTLKPGTRMIVESTAEGQDGYFYEFSNEALKRKREGRPESMMDFRIHFFPWWADKANRLVPEAGFIVPKGYRDYFGVLLSKHGIYTDLHQQAWYVKTALKLKEGMKKENPSFAEEAFEAAMEGVIYAEQMRFLRDNKRITSVPHDPSIPVDVAWDLGGGREDSTALWFIQFNGSQHRVLECYEAYQKPIDHFTKLIIATGYSLGTMYMPHDADTSVQTERSVTTKAQMVRDLMPGIKINVGDRIKNVTDGIQKTRQMLPLMWFDEQGCSDEGKKGHNYGIQALDGYRFEFDPNKGMLKETPLHNWPSHFADALREYCQAFRPTLSGGPINRYRRTSRA